MVTATLSTRLLLTRRALAKSRLSMTNAGASTSRSTQSSSDLASVKLSSPLKSLLKLESAHGDPTPSPGASITTPWFAGIREHGLSGGAGDEAWLTVGTASLCTLNSPDALCELWDYATDVGVERVYAAEIMREVGLKCISFNGIPRTINNLGALTSHFPSEVRSSLTTEQTRVVSPENVDEVHARGKALWDGIYEPHSAKLISKLADSHPDLPVHILSSHYSALLSDPLGNYPFRLGRVLTSVVAIACLRAQTGVGPQVTSHVFGLLKAGANGGGGEADQVTGKAWLTSEDGAKWVLESADKISKVIGAGSA